MTTPPTNTAAAAVFQGIADLLDAKGENPFKIRAYRNAVRTLDELNEPFTAIAARGQLRQVPGFGEAITAKLGEIQQTGTCDLYERLKAEQTAAPVIETPPADDDDIPAPW